MDKPSEKALAAFDANLPDDARVERKKMFGTPAGFVNGNMFFGVFENGMVFRVGGKRRDELILQDDIDVFEPMAGRPWKEYAFADCDRWGETDEAQAWAIEALEYTAKMPAKEKKPKKKK